MKRTLKYYRIMWLRHDLAAGLAVFFVALPLCLGIALASGRHQLLSPRCLEYKLRMT